MSLQKHCASYATSMVTTLLYKGMPYSLPFIQDAMLTEWDGEFPGGERRNAPLAATYFNLRKTTIYGGSNEVQRNIVSQVVLG